jgi:peptidoglycan-N-acetylglucosamine deacetylase
VATKTPEQILEGVKNTKPSKGDVIVIMHDTYGKQKTVDALASVIEYFQSINYEFKRFE